MANELQKEYAMRFAANASYRREVWRVLIRDYFSQSIPPGSVLLDLGCGWGEFINQVTAAQKYGMDLNPESRSKLHSEVTLLSQDCSERWELPDDHLDIVFTSNFFEHLPTKESLRRTLAECWRCLKPGGRLICMGPNIKLLPGSYWDFWDHFLPLTEASLGEALRLSDFAVDRQLAAFLPYSMSQGFAPPLFFLRSYLRLPFLWRFIGKQFLLVAHKPAPSPSATMDSRPPPR